VITIKAIAIPSSGFLSRWTRIEAILPLCGSFFLEISLSCFRSTARQQCAKHSSTVRCAALARPNSYLSKSPKVKVCPTRSLFVDIPGVPDVLAPIMDYARSALRQQFALEQQRAEVSGWPATASLRSTRRSAAAGRQTRSFHRSGIRTLRRLPLSNVSLRIRRISHHPGLRLDATGGLIAPLFDFARVNTPPAGRVCGNIYPGLVERRSG
jgi:hypothetical protein